VIPERFCGDRSHEEALHKCSVFFLFLNKRVTITLKCKKAVFVKIALMNW